VNGPLHVAVLDDYQRVAEGLADWKSLGADAKVEFFGDHQDDEDAIVKRLAPFNVIAIMRERTPFPRSLVERLPNLKLLVTTGVRNASIDVEACKARGVTVCGTRAREGTAELAWGLVLAVARGIPQQDRALRDGRWQLGLGVELREKTLGILGLGRLGSRVAGFGKAFGMKLIAWSQNLTAERTAAEGAELVSKDELFERADVLTIHLVLGERTRGLVGAKELAKMKPSAYLVNTSRGPIVDETALVEALHAGKIAGAAIDVYDREPLPKDHPLRNAPNTVLTPHIGYVSRETYEIFYGDTVEDIKAWRGGSPVRVVT
jgi:phosphoglycerate dehydrogenase-like enzyme